jgi:hypothetical protein
MVGHVAFGRPRRTRRWLFALALPALCACSDAHDLDTTFSVGAARPRVGSPSGSGGGTGLAGVGAVGGAGGTGGLATGGAFGGTGGIGTTPPPAGGPISHDVSACMPCQAAMGLTGTVDACCTANNRCGVDLSSLTGQALCVEQNAPGTQTMACPAASYMGLVSIPGCCRADATCGLVIQQLAPLGCAPAGSVSMLIGDTSGATAGVTRCTEVPAQVQGVQ